MRTSIVILSIIILGVALIAVLPRGKDEVQTSNILLLIHDQTDTTQIDLDSNRVSAYFGFDQSFFNGAHFRYVPATDRLYNQTIQYRIIPVSKRHTSILIRKREVEKYLENINSTIRNANSMPQERDHSVIWEALVRELNWLTSQSNSLHKVALIYSDLLENNNWFSVYGDEDLKLLLNHPEKVKEIFEARVQIANLQNVEVYLIHKTRSYQEDGLFRYMSGIIQEILEEHGATVTVGAGVFF